MEKNQKETSKMSKKNWIIIAVIVLAIILLLLLLKQCKGTDDYEGASVIDESVKIEKPELPELSLENCIATAANSNVAENIDDFLRYIQNAKENAQAEYQQKVADGTAGNWVPSIQFPSVSAMFQKNALLLTQEAKSLFKAYAEAYMSTNRKAMVLVEGHTCDLGSDAYNLRLSNKRAETVKNALIEAGIPADHIITVGHGESKYGMMGYTTREQHRRVNVSIK